MKKKVILVCGARPNFMKVAMIYGEMRKYRDEFNVIIVHTGQHYDFELSGVVFKDLELPEPNIYLGVGSLNHGEQTGKIMIEFEKVVLEEKPDLVVVVGDVNSTLAASIVASKLLIPLAHVEAGLRSFDRTMPEEINRTVTDILSEYLFTTEEDANTNLIREGIDERKIYLVGDVMVDCLLKNRKKTKKSRALKEMGLKKKDYAVITLHRPSNVDEVETLLKILDAITIVAGRIKIVFPIHPRTRKRMKEFGLLRHNDNLILSPPLGYLDFIHLEACSRFVLTDSGTIQSETTVLGIPCLTLRKNLERPYTVNKGTNILVGTERDRIVEASLNILDGKEKKGFPHPLWDGFASKRIVDILRKVKTERK